MLINNCNEEIFGKNQKNTGDENKKIVQALVDYPGEIYTDSKENVSGWFTIKNT